MTSYKLERVVVSNAQASGVAARSAADVASPIRGTGRGQLTAVTLVSTAGATYPRAMHLTRSTEIEAPAELVWSLVSDLPGMGELSPENVGGSWRGGATGPAVGARFRGRNRNGWRRWSTNVTVTRCEPGRSFAFVVSSTGIPVAEWAYDIKSDNPSRCTVSESWADRRPGWFKAPAALVTGGDHDLDETSANLDTTLAALKQLAERRAAGG
jgi:hypothetical protein